MWPRLRWGGSPRARGFLLPVLTHGRAGDYFCFCVCVCLCAVALPSAMSSVECELSRPPFSERMRRVHSFPLTRAPLCLGHHTMLDHSRLARP